MTKTYININGDIRDAASLNVPKDRAFRNAWKFSGDAVEVDMAKARDIQRDKLRAERKPRLESLDAEFMQTLEKEDKAAQKAVADLKKKLRDATKNPKIDAAVTPEELKAITLDDLLS